MSDSGRVITYVDAGVEALREEMRRDGSIAYIGQGIGPRGGNFRQCHGLWKEFGDDRLRDTGIYELGETGVAIAWSRWRRISLRFASCQSSSPCEFACARSSRRVMRGVVSSA